MKLSDRLQKARKNKADVLLTRLGYRSSQYDRRVTICNDCENNVPDPLYDDSLEAKLLGFEPTMCKLCGCGIEKLCYSKFKKCEAGKW